MSLSQLLAMHLADWNTGWSMGSFGAIAEFHQNDGEGTLIDDRVQLIRATARGAIRIDPAMVGTVTPIAYETLSPRPHRWAQAVALCLPESDATGARRNVLTELGPDSGAILARDRESVLFDMGLSLPQCDFCIRADDKNLLEVLRGAEGRSLFEHNNPAMPAILKAHPHRVCITSIGRAEVFQKIGGPETGGVSPAGPHTHLLPKLIRTGRTHAANTPIPDGLVPLASLHPGNPVIGPMGEDRPFDMVLFETFQALFDRYGIDGAAEEKRRLVAALADGHKPESFALPRNRVGRTAIRIGLRQKRRLAEAAGDAARTALIDAWRSVIEPRHGDDAEADDPYEHS